MPFTPTQNEANALHHLALALRPDWAHNRPGPTWLAKLKEHGTPGTFPNTENFSHALQALIHYATATTPEGAPRYKTPDLYPLDGTWWTETRPKEDPAKLPPCEQHGNTYGNKNTCRACRSEYLAGHRPETHIGRNYNPTPNGVNPQNTPNQSQQEPTPDTHNPGTTPERDENTPTAGAQAQEG